MFRAKLLCFILGIVVAVRANQENVEDVGVKRSAICLVQRVAQHNHINATYTKLHFEHRNATTHVEAKLQLGTEEYISNSTSYSKAKERAARQAYAKTKYTKPPIRNRTCLIEAPTVKSDISLLEEYADAIGGAVTYEEKPPNNTWFGYELSLNGQRASAISGIKKKEAKKLAAMRLIETIGRSQIIDTLTSKFNQTKYHGMDPVQRLRKIVQVNDLTGDAVYSVFKEVSERKAGKTVKKFVVQVDAKGYVTAGEGYTFEEAKTNAAVAMLQFLKFVVVHQPNKQN